MELQTPPSRLGDMMRRTAWSLAAVVAIAVLAAACSSSSDGPPLTPETEAVLSASAIDIGCSECRLRDVYVHDHLFTWHTLVGNEQEMPQETHDAIAAQFPDATFVGSDETDALFVSGVVVDGGVIVSVGPVEKLASDVIGVPIGVTFARDGGFAGIVQFKWNGDDWEHATSEETGVTVTTAVS